MRLTAKELQAARAAAGIRYTKIAMEFFPVGWSLIIRKNLTGRTTHRTRTIASPAPVTRRALQIFLHECAHAKFHGPGYRDYAAQREMEAEKFSFEVMRENGIKVPRKSLARAKGYVRRKAKNNPKVSEEVKRFIRRHDVQS